MDGEKRKSELNDAVLGESQKRAREDDIGEETTVTEEEVEEFYAILRRIHVAINYFRKGTGDIRILTDLGKAESLNFGSNVEVNGGKEEEEEGNVKENVSFDLNADPGSGEMTSRRREREPREGMIQTEGESTVTEDEEVEGFFAILRRIHVAVKYFQKANAGGRKSTGPPGKEWRPSFLLEDFEEDDDEGKRGRRIRVWI